MYILKRAYNGEGNMYVCTLGQAKVWGYIVMFGQGICCS